MYNLPWDAEIERGCRRRGCRNWHRESSGGNHESVHEQSVYRKRELHDDEGKCQRYSVQLLMDDSYWWQNANQNGFQFPIETEQASFHRSFRNSSFPENGY